MVPNLRAVSGLLFEKIFTVNIPNNEHTIPNEARAKGMNNNISWLPPIVFIVALVIDAARAIEAIMDPQ